MDNPTYTFLVSYKAKNSCGDIKIDSEEPQLAESDLANVRELIREKSFFREKEVLKDDDAVVITNIIPLPVIHTKIQS